MKRKTISIILILMLLQGFAYSVFATSESELNDQKADIENQKKETENKKAEVSTQIDSTQKEIWSLDASITESQTQIDALEADLKELEDSIEKRTKEIEEKQIEYEKNKKLLDDRLVAIYEAGDTSFLDILFNSENLIEFLSNYYLVNQITQCDTDLLNNIENERVQIEEEKEKLEEEKNETASIKATKEAKATELKNMKAQRQEKVNGLSSEKQALQSEIDNYNKQVAKIDSQIQEILRRAQEDIDNATGGAGLQFDGSFVWPCNNKIVTSTMKIRWGRWHKGIDIGASYENVYASASGYAYTIENPEGYGHYIMIVHGDGYITLYGHLNAYKVSYGQYVSQGQVIAQSGNSGSSQGAHLHFEVRRASSLSNFFSSSFLNPLDYLPGGYTLAAGATTPS